MALPCAILDEAAVKSIKAAIWNGKLLEDLAEQHKVNFRSISNIKRGVTWVDVKWPNGKTGAISKERAMEITRARMAARVGEKTAKAKAAANGRTSAPKRKAAKSSTPTKPTKSKRGKPK